jgi:hypothetical protein
MTVTAERETFVLFGSANPTTPVCKGKIGTVPVLIAPAADMA